MMERMSVGWGVGGCGAAEGAVEVVGPGEAGDVGGVGLAEAAASGDDDTAVGPGDEFGEHGGAGEDVGLAAGCEDAVAAGGEEVFEGLREVGGFVEGAVEGDLHGVSQGNEGAGAVDVYRVVGVENSEDDAGCPEGFHVRYGLLHREEFAGGVEEVSDAGANHGVDREAGLGDGVADEVECGCEATEVKRGAELDAVGTGFASGEAGGEGFGAEFEDDVAHRMGWARLAARPE